VKQLFSSLNAKQKGLVLVLVPVLFEIVFVGTLAVMLSQAAQELDRMELANIVLLRLNVIESQVGRGLLSIIKGEKSGSQNLAQIDQMMEVLAPKGSKSFYAERVPELQTTLNEIGDMRDGMAQALIKLRAIMANPDISPNDRIKQFSQSDLLALFMTTGTMSQRVMDAETQMRAAEPKEIERLRLTIIALLGSGIAISILLTILLARILSSDIINRLQIISTNAQLIAGRRKLPPVMEGTDEIAELDRVLHESNQLIAEASRKESAILENTVDIICSLDKKLRFQAVSAAAAAAWKCDPADLIGQSVLTLLRADTVDATRQVLQRITTEPFEGHLENIVKCKDGAQRNFLWSIRWSAQSRVFYCVVHDVTELRAIENLKKQFLSMVSHDLRTPLMSISLSLDLMISNKRGPLAPQIGETLKKTQTSLARLIDLVNELLELQKLESGKMQLDLKCVSASDVCALAKETLESMAARAGVQLKGPVGDAALFADEGRLIQVVTNLLSNAIKFSPRESTVTLSAAVDGDFVRVHITDQGPGIPEEQRTRLFQQFAQAKTKSHVSIKGTGLGLAITKAIVEAHGGTVGVESELGKGSTFWFKIQKFVDDEDEF